MIGVVLAFVSSVLWGGSDFVAGLATRRTSVLRTTVGVYAAATAVSAAALLGTHGSWSYPAMSAGLVAAVCTMAGFVAFYAGLALGPMGVVATIVATCEAIVPVVAAVSWFGDSLGWVSWLGVTVAVAGGGLLSWSAGTHAAGTRPTLLAAAAGACFGLSVVALDAAPADSGFVTPAVEVGGGLAILAMVVAVARRVPALERAIEGRAARGPLSHHGPTDHHGPTGHHGDLAAVAAGAALGLANLVLIMALRHGPLAAVGVVISLYPVTVAVLARVALRETLRPSQLFAIGAALAGCVMLAVG